VELRWLSIVTELKNQARKAGGYRRYFEAEGWPVVQDSWSLAQETSSSTRGWLLALEAVLNTRG
jgi:hypothetical protein